MKRFKIGVEFYDVKSENGPTSVGDELFHIMNGFALFSITLHDEQTELSPEQIEEQLIQGTVNILKALNEKPAEYIKASFPNYYKTTVTKQYWYHIFEDTYIKNNQPHTETKVEAEDRTFDQIMGDSDEAGGGVVTPIDIFLDKNFERMYGPPDRITDDEFWANILES